MKSVKMSAFVFAVLAASTPAKAVSVSKLIDQLAKYTYSISAETVPGDNAKEMLHFYAVDVDDQTAEDIEILDDPKGEHFPDVDGGGATYGITTVDTARADFMSNSYQDEPATLEQTKAVKDLFAQLKEAGVVFAYGPNGGSVCGTTWPAVMFVDVKGKKVYTVYFVGGEC